MAPCSTIPPCPLGPTTPSPYNHLPCVAAMRREAPSLCTVSAVEQETREGMLASDATVIKLYGGVATPDGKRLFISKLDGRFDRLANCECVHVRTIPVAVFPCGALF